MVSLVFFLSSKPSLDDLTGDNLVHGGCSYGKCYVHDHRIPLSTRVTLAKMTNMPTSKTSDRFFWAVMRNYINGE